MVNVSQERFLHVGLVTSLASKSRNFSKTEGVLRKTNVKSRFLSPEPRETKHLNRVKQVTTEDLLEGTGVKLKKLEGWIDVKKLSFEKVNKILNFLEEIGIEGKDKGKVIARRPGILTTKEELLRKRVQTMRIVGIYPESVAYVVKESPGVLTSRTEDSLPDKVKFFEGMSVKPKFTTDEILHVLTKCPDIIATCTIKLLEEKVQFLEKELKFNKHHIKNIILKQPSVLTFSKNAMLEKYKYCFEQINVSPSSIARCPRLFQCSLKRIKARYEFLKHLGRITDEMRIDDYGLGLIVTTSDKQFVEKVAKTSLEEFDQFKKNTDSIASPSEENEATIEPLTPEHTG